MEYVNSTDGHVQAGEFVMIPEDKRSSSYDLQDNSVSDTWEDADLSSLVPPNTIALFGFVRMYTSSSNDRSTISIRYNGSSQAEGIETRSFWISAQIGAAGVVELGAQVIIYAPGGLFEYRRAASTFPVDSFRFELWGYYVA
jgi:hypothetical protein